MVIAFVITLCIGAYPFIYMAFSEYIMQKPKCDVSKELKSDTSQANAGCLIVQDGKILMTKAAFTGKFAIPGGSRKQGEVSTCTAHRETFEETGLDVQVEKRIITATNGFEIFLCTPKTPINTSYTKRYEIEQVIMVEQNNPDSYYINNYGNYPLTTRN